MNWQGLSFQRGISDQDSCCSLVKFDRLCNPLMMWERSTEMKRSGPARDHSSTHIPPSDRVTEGFVVQVCQAQHVVNSLTYSETASALQTQTRLSFYKPRP